MRPRLGCRQKDRGVDGYHGTHAWYLNIQSAAHSDKLYIWASYQLANQKMIEYNLVLLWTNYNALLNICKLWLVISVFILFVSLLTLHNHKWNSEWDISTQFFEEISLCIFKYFLNSNENMIFSQKASYNSLCIYFVFQTNKYL